MEEAHNNQPESDAGKQIKIALKKAGKTQAWLAEKCGVSDNAVSKWIRTGKVSRGRIAPLCEHTGLSPDLFLGIQGDGEEGASTPERKAEIPYVLRRTVAAIAREWRVEAEDLVSDGRQHESASEGSQEASSSNEEDRGGDHPQSRRAECLASAIRSMLEGAGLEPDRLGTEEELRSKLEDSPPPPDPYRKVDSSRVRFSRRLPGTGTA